jgi:catechol-2,3-dioxygenase
MCVMLVESFNHITLNVKDLQTTIEFYTEILGMTLRHRGNKDAYLEWGTAWICIIEKPEFRGIDPEQIGVDHIAFFITEEHFHNAVKILIDNNANIVRGPIRRGSGWAVNFLDLNGIQFELHTSTLDERMSVWN